MKKLQTLFLLIAVSGILTACKKSAMPASTTPGNKISGTWRLDSLVSIFRDSTGNPIDTQLYPMQPGIVSYFKFNNDGTWSQTMTFSNTTPGDLTASSGNYALKSDTAFDMVYGNNQVFHCNITRLTAMAFTFNRSFSTLFNGVTPGFIERIFILKK